jgi:hypothetical protein
MIINELQDELYQKWDELYPLWDKLYQKWDELYPLWDKLYQKWGIISKMGRIISIVG